MMLMKEGDFKRSSVMRAMKFLKICFYLYCQSLILPFAHWQ